MCRCHIGQNFGPWIGSQNSQLCYWKFAVEPNNFHHKFLDYTLPKECRRDSQPFFNFGVFQVSFSPLMSLPTTWTFPTKINEIPPSPLPPPPSSPQIQFQNSVKFGDIEYIEISNEVSIEVFQPYLEEWYNEIYNI